MISYKCKRIAGKCRRGMSMVEVIILIVVSTIAMGAIVSTAIWTSSLQTFTRQNLGERVLMANLFETLESIAPASYDTDFNGTVRWAVSGMGGNGAANPMTLLGYTLEVREVSVQDGVRTVYAKLADGSYANSPLVWERPINAISSETVEDSGQGES